ncbi:MULTISPECIES: AbrB family transcriptional regulator [Alphaproteobacteria]|uniref:Ammonia monooxygenase n=2 Tax=Alphaproteobacteria TaxID=28211 RepID=A0A512HGA5_9HYPH|nr:MULTISPECIES: AbrB family transcriptional regulator [Alphaproteobacteria]GEO84483.1 ammonia monooxygenase [Ciceribacter naphthalenivorans]GLR22446.1 ammonia monooxygenase [Ciceribacter naphthalenivorans]GLT05302.1 ammonia monooxygenase [Sphingomonas psychrolutea]
MQPSPAGPADHQPDPGLLTQLPVSLRWTVLLFVSVLFSALLQRIHLPGSLLLGPMVAAIVMATQGARLSVHRIPYIAAHSLIGCVIARSLDPKIIDAFAADWPVFLAIVLAVIGASSVMGYLMARSGTLPGTTAVWGTSAGAASAMMLMAEAHGGDVRLVAFMQYMRVVCVASAASLVAALMFQARGGAAEEIIWFPPVDWIALAKTLAVSFAASAVGARLKIPAGTMLLPLIATAALHAAGWITIDLPPWLLAIGYGTLGWKIGLGFTRRILRHAAHALPQILASIVVLIVFCGGLAALLTFEFGIDPLTAYLATSPGGLDSVAIIAASTPVDISFVMALQTVRLFLVLLLGGPISKFVARRIEG